MMMFLFSSILFYSIILLWATITQAAQTEVRLAGIFKFLDEEVKGNTTTVIRDKQGNQILAAFVMAIKEINDKTNGFYKQLLPNTQIKFVVAEESTEFIDNIETNLALNKKAFGNLTNDKQPKLHGIIGGLTDRASDAIAQVANGFKLTQVAYGSTGSFLSYVGPYPYFLRTVKDDAYEGVALAEIINQKFKWDHVSVFSTTNSYGSDLSTQFQKNALNAGITIVNTYSFRSAQADFSIFINDAMDSGARVFVLLMQGDDAGRLLAQGFKLGLFKEGIQIVGSSELQSKECINAIFKSGFPVQDVLKGALSLKLSDAYKSRDPFKKWVERWRNQPDTITIDSGVNPHFLIILSVFHYLIIIKQTAAETCALTQDDNYPNSARTYLYQKTYNVTKAPKCTGLRFKTDFSEDGSDIDILAPYAYDAVIAWATALTELIANGNNIDDIKDSGDVIGKVICASSFRAYGVTGDISFSTGDETGYGYGDRELGTEFLLVNFQPNDYCPQTKTGGFIKISVWNQFVKPVIKNYDVLAVFNTADGSVPLSTPPPIIVTPATALTALLIVFGVIGLLVIAIFFGLLLYYRESKIIKMSQPVMIMITLVGALASILRVLWGSFSFTSSTCAGNLWFGHIGFIIFNSTLILKTWRVHLIVNTAMKKVKISTTQVMLITMGVIIGFLIYIACIQGLGNTRVDYLKTYLGRLQYKYFPICVNDMTDMTTALYVLEAALIAQGGRLCYLTRNVPDSVNDSKSIATTTYTIIFLSVIIGPIVWLIQLDPYIANFLVGIGFAIGTISGLLLLLGSKFLMISRGATVDSKLNIVYKSSITAKKDIDDRAIADPAMSHDEDAKKLKPGRGNAEENSFTCKDNVRKWQTWLQYYENQILFESISNSSSNQTGSIAPQSSNRRTHVSAIEADDNTKADNLLTSTENQRINLYTTTKTEEV